MTDQVRGESQTVVWRGGMFNSLTTECRTLVQKVCSIL